MQSYPRIANAVLASAALLLLDGCARRPALDSPRIVNALEKSRDPVRALLYDLERYRSPSRSNCINSIQAKPGDATLAYLDSLQASINRGKAPASAEEQERYCLETWALFQKVSAATAKRTTSKDFVMLCEAVLKVNPRSRFSLPFIGYQLLDVSLVLCNGLDKLGMTMDPFPLIDMLPLPRLNAWSRPVTGSRRPLILLNQEFFTYIEQLARVVYDVMTAQSHDTVAVNQRAVQSAIDANPGLLRRYDQLMLHYLGQAPAPDADIAQAEMRLDSFLSPAALARAMRVFAIGHELGHLLLHHNAIDGELEGQGASDAGTASGSTEAASWARELEADAYGFLLMAAAFGGGDGEQNEAFPMLISAPRLLFAFWEATDRRAAIASGEIPGAKISEDEETVAIRAIREMFSAPGRDDSAGVRTSDSLRISAHPPKWLRALLVRQLERDALSSYSGGRDMVDYGDSMAFVQALLEEEIFRAHRLPVSFYFLPR